MRVRPTKETDQSSRFANQPNTIAFLDDAQQCLNGLNSDLNYASRQNNLDLKTHPYESVALFSIDALPENRASALAHAQSRDLYMDSRLDFYDETIKGRRIILSHSALGAALRDNDLQFIQSRMNPNQLMWTHPLIIDGKKVAAVQAAYTYNSPEPWVYTGNDQIEAIWRSHAESLGKIARSLTQLKPIQGSLSQSLEIAPPLAADSIVISWNSQKADRDILSDRYPTHEAYLEAWKTKRAKITEPHGARILGRDNGEHIIMPLPADPFDDAKIRQNSKRIILPLINELKTAHDTVARDFKPDIFRSISIGVGVGNIENDHENIPTGQVLTEIESLRVQAVHPIFYTPEAQRILFENK